MSIIRPIDKEKKLEEFLFHTLDVMNMTMNDLTEIEKLSPYLILDGHRTGIKNDMISGYMEGAVFSLRFATIMKKLGGKRITFLIHTLRNYKTMDRMQAIFNAVDNIGDKFIKNAKNQNIKLRYFGHDIHDNYTLSDLINSAERITENCDGFELNYLTNYSELWALNNLDSINKIPEISVIGRFTKGHYSGAGIPGKASKANFMYIQQASINKNWTDEQMIILILGLLNAHISLNGFVGGKSYNKGEKDMIYEMREKNLWEEEYNISLISHHPKRFTTFTPIGPITCRF